VPGGQEMTYGRSTFEALRLAEDIRPQHLRGSAALRLAEAEEVLEEEVAAANDGLKELTVPELRERVLALGVVPAGTDREKRLPGPWVTATALGVARAAARPELAAAAGSGSGSSSTTHHHRQWSTTRCLPSALDHASAPKKKTTPPLATGHWPAICHYCALYL
jgi:hypothetical protein